MRSEATSCYFLGEEPKKLTVPFFQRRYVWEEANWRELLESLEPDNATKAFLGSVIIKRVKESKPSEGIIIDGQQRITTLSILMKSIYDIIRKKEMAQSCQEDDDESEYESIMSTLKTTLFYRIYDSDKFKESSIKIQHSRVDKEAYECIINTGFKNKDYIPDDVQKKYEDSKIMQCYIFFMKTLKEQPIEYLKKLHDSMYSKEDRILVLIELGDGDVNEQTIFDTINRAGVRLTTSDIVKNNIFKQLLDLAKTDNEKNDICKLYDDKWEKLFYSNQVDDKNNWYKVRSFGNVQRTNLDFILYCVACIKWGNGEKKEIFSNLESVYLKNTEKYDMEKLIKLVEEINEYAYIFNKYVLEFQNNLASEDEVEIFKYNEHVRRLLLILEKYGVQMFYPYVLMRIRDTNSNFKEPQLIMDFRSLETYIVRRRIARKST
ncbi:DUF262 domain-containing protein [Acetobacterium bakii]|uniref:GmrSD restriction endonucleases N-terminal domain-containing protein n=1 Tax=Acetobacterium bakii TaxID=52689 RepID=A0A0L6TW48_9FIRM|nr:DUF262 domain-containing protein [Acetobacterium bakii]KNZ40292.1 hypothetical protein AKG39_18365 [Acetobacterium bakii]